MQKIRIGKDIIVRWLIITNGEALSLEGRDLLLIMHSPNGSDQIIDFSIEDGNTIVCIYYGINLKDLGTYSFTLWENKDKIGQSAVDKTRAFLLVPNTDEED